MLAEEEKPYLLTCYMGENECFGDYYISNDQRSEFVYCATTEVDAIGLSKKFLHSKIFVNYPEIERQILD